MSNRTISWFSAILSEGKTIFAFVLVTATAAVVRNEEVNQI